MAGASVVSDGKGYGLMQAVEVLLLVAIFVLVVAILYQSFRR